MAADGTAWHQPSPDLSNYWWEWFAGEFAPVGSPGRWVPIPTAAEGDSGESHQITTAQLLAIDAAAFIRSPTIGQFRAILAADILGAKAYGKGDTLYYQSPDDDHLFIGQVTEPKGTTNLVILELRISIPEGKEFTNPPGNQSTYRPKYPINVNGVEWKMNDTSSAWLEVGPASSVISSGISEPPEWDANGIDKADVPAALEAAFPAANAGLYAKRRVDNIDPASVGTPALPEVASPVFQVLRLTDGTTATLTWVEVV